MWRGLRWCDVTWYDVCTCFYAQKHAPTCKHTYTRIFLKHVYKYKYIGTHHIVRIEYCMLYMIFYNILQYSTYHWYHVHSQLPFLSGNLYYWRRTDKIYEMHTMPRSLQLCHLADGDKALPATWTCDVHATCRSKMIKVARDCNFKQRRETCSWKWVLCSGKGIPRRVLNDVQCQGACQKARPAGEMVSTCQFSASFGAN